MIGLAPLRPHLGPAPLQRRPATAQLNAVVPCPPRSIVSIAPAAAAGRRALHVVARSASRGDEGTSANIPVGLGTGGPNSGSGSGPGSGSGSGGSPGGRRNYEGGETPKGPPSEPRFAWGQFALWAAALSFGLWVIRRAREHYSKEEDEERTNAAADRVTRAATDASHRVSGSARSAADKVGRAATETREQVVGKTKATAENVKRSASETKDKAGNVIRSHGEALHPIKEKLADDANAAEQAVEDEAKSIFYGVKGAAQSVGRALHIGGERENENVVEDEEEKKSGKAKWIAAGTAAGLGAAGAITYIVAHSVHKHKENKKDDGKDRKDETREKKPSSVAVKRGDVLEPAGTPIALVLTPPTV